MLAVKTFADMSGLSFKRIQFTPDLLPADVTGTLIYEQGAGRFSVRKGPVFTNLLLADEINRSPAKVQSALLEAMGEYQVTIGEQSFELPKPFFVMATQNPIDQEGTSTGRSPGALLTGTATVHAGTDRAPDWDERSCAICFS